MEPAVHRLLVVQPQPEALWTRLRAELDAQGAPLITFEHHDGTVTFTAGTGEFMVRARVADALMEVCGHDVWTRAFEPLD